MTWVLLAFAGGVFVGAALFVVWGIRTSRHHERVVPPSQGLTRLRPSVGTVEDILRSDNSPNTQLLGAWWLDLHRTHQREVAMLDAEVTDLASKLHAHSPERVASMGGNTTRGWGALGVDRDAMVRGMGGDDEQA